MKGRPVAKPVPSRGGRPKPAARDLGNAFLALSRGFPRARGAAGRGHPVASPQDVALDPALKLRVGGDLPGRPRAAAYPRANVFSAGARILW